MTRLLKNCSGLTKRLWAGRRGNAAVEFALMAPVLLTVIAGLIDFGMGAYEAMSLRSAARAAGQFAMKYPTDTAGIAAVVTAATTLDAQALTVTSSRFCKCSNGTTVTCDSQACSGNTPQLKYVRVSVTKTFTTMFPWPGFADGLPLAGTATLRTQ
jgi:Flp pilus assembly protein TadG